MDKLIWSVMFHVFSLISVVVFEHVHEPGVSPVSDRSVVSFRPFSGDSRLAMLDDGVTVTVLLSSFSLFLAVSPSANHPVGM